MARQYYNINFILRKLHTICSSHCELVKLEVTSKQNANFSQKNHLNSWSLRLAWNYNVCFAAAMSLGQRLTPKTGSLIILVLRPHADICRRKTKQTKTLMPKCRNAWLRSANIRVNHARRRNDATHASMTTNIRINSSLTCPLSLRSICLIKNLTHCKNSPPYNNL